MMVRPPNPAFRRVVRAVFGLCEWVLKAVFICISMLLAISFVYGGFHFCLNVTDYLGLEGGWHALAMLVLVFFVGTLALGAMGLVFLDLLVQSYEKSNEFICAIRDRMLARIPA